jgi:signal transduction histidine kinase/CheY-like chemotaxis protein/HPt (histidine-containing phosphotransfer) domain-containing protein
MDSSGNQHQHHLAQTRPWIMAALPLLPAAMAIHPLTISENAGIAGGVLVFGSALLASGFAFMLARRGFASTSDAPDTDLTGSRESSIAAGEACARKECETVRRRLAERERQLADLAHEVRNPVSAVLGYVELMRESGLRPEQLQQARIIEQSSQQILALIDDTLSRSRPDSSPASSSVDARKRSKRPGFEPRGVLEDAIAILEVQARRRGLRIEWTVDAGVPVRLQGNALHFRQVLLNLIGNALRFTAEGRISVSAALRPADAGSAAELEVRVSDTGIGIDQEACTHIFERFRQADDSISRRFGGTGLGLAIVAQLVRGWGGRLGVDSVPGQGSTFWFTHPVDVLESAPEKTEEGHAAPTPPRLSARLEDLRILIAEDNAFGRELLTHILNRAGARVTPTTNAAAMLRHARAQDYDLVILDLRLPDMRGDEAARRLRRLSPRRLPVIILSADAVSTNPGQESGSEVDLWMSKPVNAVKLIAAIRGLLPRAVAAPAPCSFAEVPPHLRERLQRSLLELKDRMLVATNEAKGDLLEVTHELRGVAGYFGLQEISEAAADLEKLYRRDGAPEVISGRVLALAEQIEAAAVPSRHFQPVTGDRPAALQ